MAARASLLAHREEPVQRPGHRAAHKQQVPLGVHAHHPEAELGEAACAHVARQALRACASASSRRSRAGAGRSPPHQSPARRDTAPLRSPSRARGRRPRRTRGSCRVFCRSVRSCRYSTLISTSTPAGRSSFVSASTVCERESRMSISRLCVFSSNCSRLFLSMCGLRSTVHSCRLVGNGMGPETCAPVFSAVRTMSAAAWSISAWSNALRRMRILPAIGPLLENLRDHAGAHRAAALANREPQLLLHRDRRDQLDRHLRVVPRHHHPHPPRQPHRPPHVLRPKNKLPPIPLEKRRVPAPLLLR